MTSTSPSLPPDLKAALDRLAQSRSRGDLALRATAISETYRGGGNSGRIKSDADALAYALARMPATYAAVTASLDALQEARPDFAPRSLLDIGAGPGTASWAASEAFVSLTDFFAIDSNPALRSLALDGVRGSPRLRDLTYHLGSAAASLAQAAPADLVVASYFIGEVADAQHRSLAELMWAKTTDTLLIVEPGTPTGYQRMLEMRRHLIAAGAHVAAPCPHDGACPLHLPDWCHFSQRLPRSRDHLQLKQATVPFEDERFAYVALTRAPLAQRPSRVLAQPEVGKAAVTAKLCTESGVVNAAIPRRDKAAYARARRWRWGDAIPDTDSSW